MATIRETRHAQLIAHGFERLDSTGSKFASYRLQRNRGHSINVDVGPRGSTVCWIVYVGVDRKCISNRIPYDDVLTITEAATL